MDWAPGPTDMLSTAAEMKKVSRTLPRSRDQARRLAVRAVLKVVGPRNMAVHGSDRAEASGSTAQATGVGRGCPSARAGQRREVRLDGGDRRRAPPGICPEDPGECLGRVCAVAALQAWRAREYA